MVVKGTCSLRKRSSLLGVSRRTVKKHDIRWKPVKRLRTAEASATSFLEEMATPLPDKKLVSKKTGKEACLLQQSLRELHREFCSSGNTLSLSTFAKCRPPNVRLMAQACLRQCLCNQCGVDQLDQHLLPLTQQHQGELTWYCWQTRTVSSKGKQV